MPKILTLCADDYALNPAVSRAILQLAEAGRLSAISCMSGSAHWPEHAAWLKPLVGKVDIGVHLTLTELAPLGPMPLLAPDGKLPPLNRVLRRGLLHTLPRQEIGAELERQVQRFSAELGVAPDFIDGHQHVHLLPGVRESVLALWHRYLRPQNGYLRSCAEPFASIRRRGIQPLKALIISGLSQSLTRTARHKGIACNDSFRGVHDFSGQSEPQPLFQRFLHGGGERPLVMCHPGLKSDDASDPLQRWRPREFAYLSSEAFAADLAAAGYRLARLPR